MNTRKFARRHWLVPEVVQTSAMDCGPAGLKALLEGFRIPVSYDRLREACQTDIDGTSIDTLEEVAGQLGLAAEQVIIPTDHILLSEARALPALIVVRLPNGLTHFVLAWRRLGPFVQVMDPGVGRRWVLGSRFLEEVYIHAQRVPSSAWREWAGSDEFLRPLAVRLAQLGVGRAAANLIGAAVAAPGWESLARLDAAVRLGATLVGAGGLRRGHEVARFLNALMATDRPEAIPARFWSVTAASPAADDSEPHLLTRGAVLVRVTGRRSAQAPQGGTGPPDVSPALNPELAAALEQSSSRTRRTLLALLRGAGPMVWWAVSVGLVVVAIGIVFEGLLLRAAIDIGRNLRLTEQRLLAIGALLLVVTVFTAVELGVAHALARLGRRLEVGLRVRFLEAIPRLHDRYFQSRPTSDMAERAHNLQQVRLFPRLAGQFLRTAIALGITAGAIAWSDSAGAVTAIGAAVFAVGLPVALLPVLQRLDLRVRTHAGALNRFYLDALQGIMAVRAHGNADRAIRREHESLLVEWARASQGLLYWIMILEGLQAIVGFGLAGWLLFRYPGHAAQPAGALLLAYWTLNLPVLGGELAPGAFICPFVPTAVITAVIRSRVRSTAGAAAGLSDNSK